MSVSVSVNQIETAAENKDDIYQHWRSNRFQKSKNDWKGHTLCKLVHSCYEGQSITYVQNIATGETSQAITPLTISTFIDP